MEVVEQLPAVAGNNIVEIPKSDALAYFSEFAKLNPILQRIAEEARALVADVSTSKGRKEIASMAYKVARTKTYLDGVGKELVADLKELPKRIDANRRSVREFLDELAADVRKPLDEWEAEQARIEAEAKAAEEAAALAKQIEADHEVALLMNEKFDRDREDERRRQEQERAEREARIAKEAADKARQEAEEKAAREKAEAERQAAEAKLAAERAEAQRKDAEARAAKAEQEAKDRAAKAAEEAAAAERQRIEREAAAAQAEAEAREKDKQRRAVVHNEALRDLLALGIDEETSKKVIRAVVMGQVSHISISY